MLSNRFTNSSSVIPFVSMSKYISLHISWNLFIIFCGNDSIWGHFWYFTWFLFLKSYFGISENFLMEIRSFLGNYALPLSYCRCIPSFCIGINLLLRTLMFEVLVCLWLYINTQVIICQYFFQINFNYFHSFL